MRFAAKMTALITMLLAASLAVGGYLVMSSSFDARLQGQVRDAQEGVRLLGMTVQALCAREQGQDTVSSGAIERALEALPQDRSYCLHAADGTVLSESADFPQEAVQNGRAGVIVSRVQNTTSGSRLITTSLLTLYGGTYSLTCLNDITDMLREAETELQRFRWILAAVLGAAVAATAALSVYMTRPLRRISRTARQLAAGQTDRRVTVRTDDELGDLAQNFNAMADALEARLRELAAAAQRQKEFTASFAHELKTPLTSVIGYADTLRSRTLPSEMQFEAANAIYTEGKRLERMSFALLDLFALERSEPSFSRVQTGALAASVQKKLRIPACPAEAEPAVRCGGGGRLGRTGAAADAAAQSARQRAQGLPVRRGSAAARQSRSVGLFVLRDRSGTRHSSGGAVAYHRSVLYGG